MQSDYSHLNDVIYTVSEDVKLVFHTVVSCNSGIRVYPNYNEYKINNNQKCNTMIKRTLSYYIFFDDRRNNRVEKIVIFPENMFDLLARFEHVKHHWIDNDMGIYAMMDSTLVVVNLDDYIIMKLPMDKAIKISPGVMRTDMGDIKCIDLYLNSNEPLQISHSTFLGMYYVLKNLDMLNYANTSISFAMLMGTPINRTDLSGEAKYSNQQPLEDTSSSSGRKGVSTVKDNKSAFFD